MSATAPAPVVRTDVLVRYVEVPDELVRIRAAWPELEAAVGSLRGRHFLAAFDPVAGWYRACVTVGQQAGPAEQALPDIVVPGGRYLRVRLRGDPPHVYDEIAPAYALLESSARRDDSRPSLEVYRRLDAVDVLMPVT